MSSAKEKMLEDVEKSRSFMKRINRAGDITFVPDTIKGLRNIKGDHSTLTVEF